MAKTAAAATDRMGQALKTVQRLELKNIILLIL
jgi:hypothetical protein